jgi:RNA polymerase sigma factor (sigma-70 family)
VQKGKESAAWERAQILAMGKINMPAPNHGLAAQLLRQSNEDLLLQAIGLTSSPLAVEVLITRHERWTRHFIAWRARRTGLKPVDVEDAQQEALLALRKAIGHCDRGRVGNGGFVFRAFATKVVSNSFNDYVRRYRRRERRMDRSPSASDALNAMPDKAPTSDPEAAAIAQEWKTAWVRTLNGLEEDDRRLVEAHVAGTRLRAIANDLGHLYSVTKRRWQTLTGDLRQELGHWVE